MYEERAATTYFGAEAIPYFDISFGPDQLAAFLGAKLKRQGDSSWADPFVEDWKSLPELRIAEENPVWKRMIEFYRHGAQFSDTKFLLGVLDLHSNMDWLRAIRGTDRLCLDLLDSPDEIERRMKEVRRLFPAVYETMYRAGKMKGRGTIGWIPLYCEDRFAAIACDFICMVSPEIARRLIIPALEEEASYLDHCIYHLDGPEALVHLDDLLAIPRIDAIEWTPTQDGSHIEWMELFKRILRAGKSIIIYPQSGEQLKAFHRELGPKGIVYQLTASSEREVEGLITWLRSHT